MFGQLLYFATLHLPTLLGLSAPAVATTYDISATLNPHTHQVQGQLKLRVTNTTHVPLYELRFHLYLNAFAHKNTLFMRTSQQTHRGQSADLNQAGWIKVTDVIVGEPHPRNVTTAFTPLEDGTVARLTLGRPLLPGQSQTVVMQWTSRLPRVFARTGYVDGFYMVAQWFPKLGFLLPDGSWHCPPFHSHSEFFSPFSNYRLKLTVPAQYTVGTTGTITQRRIVGDQQVVTIDAAFVHDVAWVASPDLKETSRRLGAVTVHYLSEQRDADSSHHRWQLLSWGLRELESRFGKYPYSDLTIIDTPANAEGAAAMEYPMLFTTYSPRWMPRWVHQSDEVLLHELTHQYFQGVIASNEVQEPWLDEGVTTYVTATLLDAYYGKDRSLFAFGPIHLGHRTQLQLMHQLARGDYPIGLPAARYPSWNSYLRHVYARSALLMLTVEDIVGAAAFARALSAYATKYRFAHPTGNELQKQILAHTPSAHVTTVTQLLHQFVRSPGRLAYRIDCAAQHVQITRIGTVSVPLELTTYTAEGQMRRTTVPPTPSSRVLTIAASNVSAATIGPPDRLLLDSNSHLHRCYTEAKSSALARGLTTILQTALQVIGP